MQYTKEVCYRTSVHFALRLFRQTFEQIVKKGVIPPLPAAVPKELQRAESGVYVAAFEKPGRKPRGRVGSYLPTKSTLAEEILVQAATLADTFPFRREDLPFLTYEVLLTKPPQFLADISDLPPDAGLLVRSSRGQQGVSLPGAIAREPWERFREICRQAGINERLDDARTYKFGIDVLSEDEFRHG